MAVIPYVPTWQRSGFSTTTYWPINVKTDFGAIGDGLIDDTDAIQAAIDLAALSSREIYLPEGTYLITAALTGWTAGMRMYGSGLGTSILQASGNFLGVISMSGTTLENTLLTDFKIDTSGTTTRCISVADNTNTSAGTRPIGFSRLWLLGDLNGALFYSAGNLLDVTDNVFNPNSLNTVSMHMDMWNLNTVFSNNTVIGGGKGLLVTRSGASNVPEGIDITDNVFVNFAADYNIKLDCACLLILINNNILDQAGATAIDIGAGAYAVSVKDNWMGLRTPFTGTGARIRNDAGSGIQLSGNTFGPCTTGIKVEASVGSRVSKLEVSGNYFTTTDTVSISLDSVNGCTVTNNMDNSSPTGGSFTTAATFGAGSYLFDNNQFSTTAPSAFHTGSTYRFGNDTGIKGRNKGKATAAAATSLAITHGLLSTPSSIRVTPEGDTGAFYLSAIGGTTFTVNWATIGSQSWHWEAEV